jgi:Raf kinase inhibitor-like YbhB/YbcL family protein
MQISSPVFNENGPMPAKYTCDGENISPPLEIIDVPEHAQSLVLFLDDPDAPAGIFTHWVMWNIDPGRKKIIEGEVPNEASEGKNNAGEISYFGPCPPQGTHRYVFRIYTLDTEIALKAGSSVNDLRKSMRGHIIDSAELISFYKRQ